MFEFEYIVIGHYMNKELLSIKIDKYFQELQENIVEANRLPRLRTPRPAADINAFFKMVGNIITTQQKGEGVVKPLLFTEDFPEKEDNIQGEVITYSVLNRKPGLIESLPMDGIMGNGKRQRVRLFREAVDDPDNPGMKIFTFGQWFDNLVVFNIWALTNKVANQRALWFEDLIENWRWYFEASGISKIYYHERLEDKGLSPDNRKLVCRPLVYYVRTEKVTNVHEVNLRSLIVNNHNL